jgi:DNA-binding GntR family transcriptional regulator
LIDSQGRTKRERPSDESIHQQIYTAIAEHHLPPGTRLPEDSLAEVFNVSRTRIRKTLLLLSRDGVVTVQRNRGAHVSRPSIEEVRHIFAVRRILEAATTGAIARSATRTQLRDLKDFIAAERLAYQRPERRTAIRLSGEFHLKLAELTGNPVIVDVLRGLVSRTILAVAVYGAYDGSSCNLREHEELVRLLASGDVDAALAHMDKHLANVEASLNLNDMPKPGRDLKVIFARVASGQSHG